MRRLGTLVALAAALVTVRPPPAAAHAFLDHADPRVGSTVDRSPAALTLQFTESIEPAFCRVDVLDHAGKRLETAPTEHPTGHVADEAAEDAPEGLGVGWHPEVARDPEAAGGAQHHHEAPHDLD